MFVNNELVVSKSVAIEIIDARMTQVRSLYYSYHNLNGLAPEETTLLLNRANELFWLLSAWKDKFNTDPNYKPKENDSIHQLLKEAKDKNPNNKFDFLNKREKDSLKDIFTIIDETSRYTNYLIPNLLSNTQNTINDSLAELDKLLSHYSKLNFGDQDIKMQEITTFINNLKNYLKDIESYSNDFKTNSNANPNSHQLPVGLSDYLQQTSKYISDINKEILNNITRNIDDIAKKHLDKNKATAFSVNENDDVFLIKKRKRAGKKVKIKKKIDDKDVFMIFLIKERLDNNKLLSEDPLTSDIILKKTEFPIEKMIQSIENIQKDIEKTHSINNEDSNENNPPEEEKKIEEPLIELEEDTIEYDIPEEISQNNTHNTTTDIFKTITAPEIQVSAAPNIQVDSAFSKPPSDLPPPLPPNPKQPTIILRNIESANNEDIQTINSNIKTNKSKPSKPSRTKSVSESKYERRLKDFADLSDKNPLSVTKTHKVTSDLKKVDANVKNQYHVFVGHAEIKQDETNPSKRTITTNFNLGKKNRLFSERSITVDSIVTTNDNEVKAEMKNLNSLKDPNIKKTFLITMLESLINDAGGAQGKELSLKNLNNADLTTVLLYAKLKDIKVDVKLSPNQKMPNLTDKEIKAFEEFYKNEYPSLKIKKLETAGKRPLAPAPK